MELWSRVICKLIRRLNNVKSIIQTKFKFLTILNFPFTGSSIFFCSECTVALPGSTILCQPRAYFLGRPWNSLSRHHKVSKFSLRKSGQNPLIRYPQLAKVCFSSLAFVPIARELRLCSKDAPQRRHEVSNERKWSKSKFKSSSSKATTKAKTNKTSSTTTMWQGNGLGTLTEKRRLRENGPH